MSASPVDTRADTLSSLGPKGWYSDHLGRSVACACTTTAPDPRCNLGWALFRLAKSSRESEKRPART